MLLSAVNGAGGAFLCSPHRLTACTGQTWIEPAHAPGSTTCCPCSCAEWQLSDTPALQVEACLNLQEGYQPGAVSATALAEDVYGPFSGQVTSAARQAFRRAILEAGPRLVEAMFLCEIATASEALSGGHLSAYFDADAEAVCKTGCLRCLHAGARTGCKAGCLSAFMLGQGPCKAGCRNCSPMCGHADLSAFCKASAGSEGLRVYLACLWGRPAALTMLDSGEEVAAF